MNELKIINTIPATIEWDKETALKEAKDIMAKYDGLEFIEEQLPTAKKEVATLRKVSKEINAQALAIDKELTANVKEFRNEVKEVKSIVDSGINFINDQVKSFELKIAQERENEIKQWEEWNSIKYFTNFNEKWLLKKWEDKLLKAEFLDIKNVIDSAIGTIKMTCNTLKLESDFYVDKLKTMPLEQVVERMNEDYNNLNKKNDEPVVKIEINSEEQVIEVSRKLKGTITQLTALKDYAIKIGVEWIK